MKKLIDVQKEIDAKKQASAMKKVSIEKKYDAKLSKLNNKSYQISQVDMINLIEYNDNISSLKLSLNVYFRLSNELIDSLINIVSSNSVYSQKNCNSERPVCTFIHRLEV